MRRLLGILAGHLSIKVINEMRLDGEEKHIEILRPSRARTLGLT